VRQKTFRRSGSRAWAELGSGIGDAWELLTLVFIRRFGFSLKNFAESLFSMFGRGVLVVGLSWKWALDDTVMRQRGVVTKIM
jgi:hypothetical protein